MALFGAPFSCFVRMRNKSDISPQKYNFQPAIQESNNFMTPCVQKEKEN